MMAFAGDCPAERLCCIGNPFCYTLRARTSGWFDSVADTSLLTSPLRQSSEPGRVSHLFNVTVSATRAACRLSNQSSRYAKQFGHRAS